MAAEQPLGSVDVVELGTALAGPFATKLLADYGANVVKIERPDTDRSQMASSPSAPNYTFATYNVGKDAITLDLKSSEGQDILMELISEADVFLENMRNGVVERLGFDWEVMRKRNPGLIYCSVSGFGDTGLYADRPAFNGVVTGMSGWLSGEDNPTGSPVAAADHITGFCAWGGVLTALVNRGVRGRGEKVEVSMLDAMMSCAGEEFAGYSAVRSGYDVGDPYKTPIQPGGYYAVADGHITLVVTQGQWEAFTNAIERPEWADSEHRFAEESYRLDNPDDLRTELEAVLCERTADEWLTHLNSVAPRVPCGPVYWIDDVVNDQHIIEREQVWTIDHPETGDHLVPRPPVRFSSHTQDVDSVQPAPDIGEHTESTLRSLGYTDDEIRSLRDGGII
ncbi:CaiB/BaiF CoA-transferase family protein [Haloferax sp. ATB1]|uniref:CaiB/BaiF CoA transferase family protein n=1 Tax=Haloferax sp. ATB1 TaxID=1508454 RepID=UPI0005B22475|nr:CaiB/BaiF CoA-transferase family protein [Haloferax sp. ATB1]